VKKRKVHSVGGATHLRGSPSGGQLLVALARGLDVLKAVGHTREPLGNAELAQITGLPKATVSRMTYTLAALGYIDYLEASGRYRIGAGGVSLAYNALGGNLVAHAAIPFMEAMSERLGLAVTIGVRTGLQMTYLATERGQAVFSLRLTPGSSIPIMSTSMGHGYLASLNEEQRGPLLQLLRRATPEGWGKAYAILQKNIRVYETRGFCSVVGLWHPHINAVSVPFLPRDGTPTVVFSCGGLSNYAPGRRLTESIGPDLVRLVNCVREALETGQSSQRRSATKGRIAHGL
jgi:DNA-binding IclR family transcriptional regulator